jgi:hypothetical protein
MKKVLLFFALLMLTHTAGATITISNDATTDIVTIEQTSAKEIGYALQNNTLSTEERNMITSANGQPTAFDICWSDGDSDNNEDTRKITDEVYFDATQEENV